MPGETRKIPGTVKVLGAVSFFNDIASEMIYPIIPVFLTAVLGAPVTAVGLIEGVAEATASFLKVVSGWWSDKIGRRKPLVIFGYACSVAAKPIFAVAQAWPTVLFGRFLDRFGKGSRTAARDAWIADVTPPEIRGASFGLHRAFDTLGAIIGPLLTFVLLASFHDGHRTLFLIAFIPGAVALLLLVLGAKEAPSRREIPAVPASKDGRPLPRSFWIFMAFAVLFGLANSADAFLILRGVSLGWSVAAAALAYALHNVVYALASYPAGSLSDRVSRKFVFGAGVAVFGVSYLAFAGTSSAAALWPLFAFYGLAAAFTEATSRALIADVAPEESYGSAYGIYGAAMSFASLAASLWFGAVWKFYGAPTAFAVSGALGLVAAIGLIATGPRTKAISAPTGGK